MDRNSNQWYGISDPALLEKMGDFVRKTRLNQNKTQQKIAEIAGVNRSTLIQIEKGAGGTLLSFIQILRALEQLHVLEIFEIKQELSPLKLAEMEMKMRRRASRKMDTGEKTKSSW